MYEVELDKFNESLLKHLGKIKRGCDLDKFYYTNCVVISFRALLDKITIFNNILENESCNNITSKCKNSGDFKKFLTAYLSGVLKNINDNDFYSNLRSQVEFDNLVTLIIKIYNPDLNNLVSLIIDQEIYDLSKILNNKNFFENIENFFIDNHKDQYDHLLSCFIKQKLETVWFFPIKNKAFHEILIKNFVLFKMSKLNENRSIELDEQLKTIRYNDLTSFHKLNLIKNLAFAGLSTEITNSCMIINDLIEICSDHHIETNIRLNSAFLICDLNPRMIDLNKIDDILSNKPLLLCTFISWSIKIEKFEFISNYLLKSRINSNEIINYKFYNYLLKKTDEISFSYACKLVQKLEKSFDIEDLEKSICSNFILLSILCKLYKNSISIDYLIKYYDKLRDNEILDKNGYELYCLLIGKNLIYAMSRINLTKNVVYFELISHDHEELNFKNNFKEHWQKLIELSDNVFKEFEGRDEVILLWKLIVRQLTGCNINNDIEKIHTAKQLAESPSFLQRVSTNTQSENILNNIDLESNRKFLFIKHEIMGINKLKELLSNFDKHLIFQFKQLNDYSDKTESKLSIPERFLHISLVFDSLADDFKEVYKFWRERNVASCSFHNNFKYSWESAPIVGEISSQFFEKSKIIVKYWSAFYQSNYLINYDCLYKTIDKILQVIITIFTESCEVLLNQWFQCIISKIIKNVDYWLIVIIDLITHQMADLKLIMTVLQRLSHTITTFNKYLKIDECKFLSASYNRIAQNITRLSENVKINHNMMSDSLENQEFIYYTIKTCDYIKKKLIKSRIIKRSNTDFDV